MLCECISGLWQFVTAHILVTYCVHCTQCHDFKIDCVAPQDVNTRVTWGAFIAKICMVPGHNLVPAQCSGLGTRLRGRRPRDEKPQQYTVHAQCSLRMLTRKTAFRASFLRKIRGGTWESRWAVGTLSSLLVMALLTMWLKPLPLYARYNMHVICYGWLDWWYYKLLSTCRGFTSSSIQFVSPKGKTPSSSRWLRRQVKVWTTMCVSCSLGCLYPVLVCLCCWYHCFDNCMSLKPDLWAFYTWLTDLSDVYIYRTLW